MIKWFKYGHHAWIYEFSISGYKKIKFEERLNRPACLLVPYTTKCCAFAEDLPGPMEM